MPVNWALRDYSGPTLSQNSRSDKSKASQMKLHSVFKEGATGQTIIFHFARNIPEPSNPSDSAAVIGQEIPPLMEVFPLYRP